ncbi:MAG: deoxyribonuclease IV [Candidatus Marsarchaeota archaeon]|nr:deoxyribonuclease IV [Candidatus Marsarchaeota archaeon]
MAIRYGFHMSISGSISNAALHAGEKGYGAFQIFTANARSWKANRVDESEGKKFFKYSKKFDSIPFAHAPYLCNPASPKQDTWEKSIELLIGNMENCKALGIQSIVVHMGSHVGSGREAGIERITEFSKRVMRAAGSVRILFENSSGYTNSLGSSFNEMAEIMSAANSKNIGICIDTCHAFAAGYDMRTENGVKSMFEEIERSMGLDKIGLIHLNDAKFDLGSGLDRHWHIGRGFIGEHGFVNLFKSGYLNDKCLIMETPENGEGDDSSNERELLKIMQLAGYKDV